MRQRAARSRTLRPRTRFSRARGRRRPRSSGVLRATAPRHRAARQATARGRPALIERLQPALRRRKAHDRRPAPADAHGAGERLEQITERGTMVERRVALEPAQHEVHVARDRRAASQPLTRRRRRGSRGARPLPPPRAGVPRRRRRAGSPRTRAGAAQLCDHDHRLTRGCDRGKDVLQERQLAKASQALGEPMRRERPPARMKRPGAHHERSSDTTMAFEVGVRLCRVGARRYQDVGPGK